MTEQICHFTRGFQHSESEKPGMDWMFTKQAALEHLKGKTDIRAQATNTVHKVLPCQTHEEELKVHTRRADTLPR